MNCPYCHRPARRSSLPRSGVIVNECRPCSWAVWQAHAGPEPAAPERRAGEAARMMNHAPARVRPVSNLIA